MVTPAVYAAVSLLLASVLSASGALVIVFGDDRHDAWRRYLTPLAVGVILGAVFLHLLPRIVVNFGLTPGRGLLAVGGVVGSYAIETAVHRRFRDREFEAFSVTLVVGDGIHNVVDGIVVASSYVVSVPVGIASTLAVVIHKLPKELGDFGALLAAGVDEWRAVEINVLTNLAAFAGAGAALLLAGVEGAIGVLLPLAVGNFLYVAVADLLPEMRDEDAASSTQLAGVCVGVAAMYAITLV